MPRNPFLETARLTLASFVPQRLHQRVWHRLSHKFTDPFVLSLAAWANVFAPEAAAPTFSGNPASPPVVAQCRQAAALLDTYFRLRTLPAGFQVTCVELQVKHSFV